MAVSGGHSRISINSKSKKLYQGYIKFYVLGTKLYERILPSKHWDFQDSPPSLNSLETGQEKCEHVSMERG